MEQDKIDLQLLVAKKNSEKLLKHNKNTSNL